jgi:hypothetical protein
MTDILFADAGVVEPTLTAEASPEDYDRTFDYTSLVGP